MEISTSFGLNLGTIGVTIIAIGAGAGYNYLIERLKEDDRLEGYSALAVVVGVLMTLSFAVPFIGIMPVLIVGWLFAATGTPMIIGDVSRAWKERKQRDTAVRNYLNERNEMEATDGDTSRSS